MWKTSATQQWSRAPRCGHWFFPSSTLTFLSFLQLFCLPPPCLRLLSSLAGGLKSVGLNLIKYSADIDFLGCLDFTPIPSRLLCHPLLFFPAHPSLAFLAHAPRDAVTKEVVCRAHKQCTQPEQRATHVCTLGIIN